MRSSRVDLPRSATGVTTEFLRDCVTFEGLRSASATVEGLRSASTTGFNSSFGRDRLI